MPLQLFEIAGDTFSNSCLSTPNSSYAMPFPQGVPMITGNRIRAIREDQQLSQLELSSRAGISEMSIARFESGEAVASLPVLEKIAQAFSVPLYDLFSDPQTRPADMQTRISSWLEEQCQAAIQKPTRPFSRIWARF